MKKALLLAAVSLISQPVLGQGRQDPEESTLRTAEGSGAGGDYVDNEPGFNTWEEPDNTNFANFTQDAVDTFNDIGRSGSTGNIVIAAAADWEIVMSQVGMKIRRFEDTDIWPLHGQVGRLQSRLISFGSAAKVKTWGHVPSVNSIWARRLYIPHQDINDPLKLDATYNGSRIGVVEGVARGFGKAQVGLTGGSYCGAAACAVAATSEYESAVNGGDKTGFSVSAAIANATSSTVVSLPFALNIGFGDALGVTVDPSWSTSTGWDHEDVTGGFPEKNENHQTARRFDADYHSRVQTQATIGSDSSWAFGEVKAYGRAYSYVESIFHFLERD